ncbi:hypothetical protein CDAR_591301 [Caerostris darwini]|uniref:Uncharacterized protein n=1 Tax=Caerostris darwini TaxID=1538125 RepID=A0AAV4RM41_9ARAC|nr:hypothetical protein CDAR_591301 [Caerostris darwini]
MELYHKSHVNWASLSEIISSFSIHFRSQEENPRHLIDEALNLSKPMLLLINTPSVAPLAKQRDFYLPPGQIECCILGEIITHRTRTNLIKSLCRKTGFAGKEGNAENQERSLITSLENRRNGEIPSSGKKCRQYLAHSKNLQDSKAYDPRNMITRLVSYVLTEGVQREFWAISLLCEMSIDKIKIRKQLSNF